MWTIHTVAVIRESAKYVWIDCTRKYSVEFKPLPRNVLGRNVKLIHSIEIICIITLTSSVL